MASMVLDATSLDACQAQLDACDSPYALDKPLTWFDLSTAANARAHAVFGVLRPFMEQPHQFVVAGGAIEGFMSDVLGKKAWCPTAESDIDVFVLNWDAFCFLQRWLWNTAETTWLSCTAHGATFNITLAAYANETVPRLPIQFVLRFGINVVLAATIKLLAAGEEPTQETTEAAIDTLVPADVLFTHGDRVVNTFDLTHCAAALRAHPGDAAKYQVGLHAGTLTAWRTRVTAPMLGAYTPSPARCLKAVSKGYALAHTDVYEDVTAEQAVLDLHKVRSQAGFARPSAEHESVFPAHARLFWAHRLRRRIMFGIKLVLWHRSLHDAGDYYPTPYTDETRALDLEEMEGFYPYYREHEAESDAQRLFGPVLPYLADTHTLLFVLDSVAYREPCASTSKYAWPVLSRSFMTLAARRAAIDALRSCCTLERWQFVLRVIEAHDRITCSSNDACKEDIDLVASILLLRLSPKPSVGGACDICYKVPASTLPALRAALDLQSAISKHDGSVREAMGCAMLAVGTRIAELVHDVVGPAGRAPPAHRDTVSLPLLQLALNDQRVWQCAPTGELEGEVGIKVLTFL